MCFRHKTYGTSLGFHRHRTLNQFHIAFCRSEIHISGLEGVSVPGTARGFTAFETFGSGFAVLCGRLQRLSIKSFVMMIYYRLTHVGDGFGTCIPRVQSLGDY